MKMIISAGGTGGHIYPALAIINKFQEKDKDFDVLYIGTHNRMENKIVPERNIPYESIKIYGFSKKNILRDIKDIGYLFNSYNKCVDIMKKFKPDIVVGVGGYVTMPVLLAAKHLKIKSVIHEQNSIPGKTNKFLSKGVNAVFTSFETSKKYFKDGTNVIYTGNPSGDNVKSLKPIKKESLGFTKSKKLVVVTSGSLGSSGLHQKMIDFLNSSSKEDYEVLYLTGNASFEEFNKNKFGNNIKILPYLDNLAALFKEADLVISRAGAGTISELLISKTPAILIPSPNVSNNHQYYNAYDLSKENLVIMIEEKDLDGKLLNKEVKELLNNNDKYKNIKNNLNKLKDINSSDIIYNKIKEIVNGK